MSSLADGGGNGGAGGNGATGGASGSGSGSGQQQNNHHHQRPWTPPLWLTGEKQKERPRQWKVPLGGSSWQVTQKAKRIISRNQPYHPEQQSIHLATAKLAEYQQKCAAAQKKIDTVERAREVSLQDIRDQRAEETAVAVAIVEKKLRAKFEKETKERQLEWEKGVQEECSAKRKLAEEEAAAEKQQESNKRLQIASTGAEGTSEWGAGAGNSSSSSAVLVESEKLQQSQAKTKELQQELAQKRAKLAELNENRGEIIWMLKLAIKAEETQKTIKLASEKKPEAKITNSPSA
jgi:hypothetical protein